MKPQSLTLSCSSEIGRILVEGAVEILGVSLSQTLLSSEKFAALIQRGEDSGSIPLSLFDRFQEELVDRLGVAGGHGIALRIGRASFRYGLRRFGKASGLSSLEFRLLPTPRRIQTGLEKLAQIINGDSGQTIQVDQQPGRWVWRQAMDPDLEKNISSPSQCFLIAGVLQGFLSWASGGKFYPLNCQIDQEKGALFQVFQIDQRPID